LPDIVGHLNHQITFGKVKNEVLQKQQ